MSMCCDISHLYFVVYVLPLICAFCCVIDSFGMLSSDTPTNDQNKVPFITPSPASVEGLAPKAPLKKVSSLLSFLSL